MKLTREQMLAEMGITPVWRLREPAAAKPGIEMVAAEPETTADEVAATAKGHVFPETAPVAVDALKWPELLARISGCTACPLCTGRKQAVPGVGDLNPDWLFIGEGPGAEEDARGEPFVGQAGKLLDAMLAAIDLKRGEDVYIANAVKCRPPNNRTPEVAEISACAPYLKRQIALLQPRLIVLLGRAAAHAVLGNVGPLGALRGKPFEFPASECNGRRIPVVVTYHPAYLLRTLPDKAKAWEDLCRARALMRM